ncbi:MAG: hypothetical protein ACE5EX_03805 [Phycisphaerae bacterium]
MTDRPHLSVLALLCVAAAWMAARPAFGQDPSWKLYDVRDLIGLLPPLEHASSAATASPRTPGGLLLSGETLPAAGTGGPGSHRTPASFVGGAASVDELMDRICGTLFLDPKPMLPGVYGIEAEEAEHERVQQMLGKIRALYSERYAVDLVWYTVPIADGPSIGDEITPVEPMHRHRFMVARRAPTALFLGQQHAYLADLTAVVATGAVGYDPETKRVDNGLRLSLLVGAGPDTKDTTWIQLIGELRRVTMGKFAGSVRIAEPAAPQPHETTRATVMPIELPTVGVRSIHASLRVELGKLTVLNVLDGFGGGDSIVVAVSVTKL